MAEMTATVCNVDGIRCGPSVEIVKAVERYEGDMLVYANGRTTELESAQELASLELAQGDLVRIMAWGPDDVQLCRKLVALFEKEYGLFR